MALISFQTSKKRMQKIWLEYLNFNTYYKMLAFSFKGIIFSFYEISFINLRNNQNN